MSIKGIDKDTFESEVLNHQGRVLVDFYSDNCGPCKQMANMIEGMEGEFDAKIVKIDAFENMDLSKEHGVSSIPAFFLYENGKIIKEHVGMKPKTELKDWLDN